ncbi:protein lifeguard 1 [Eucyclogobius newberryi]|uniref:protein lifeguard 1 n=1 Tax=Eucyclogobius newberryi TaxID=166745 RepID=UPI003B5CD9EB
MSDPVVAGQDTAVHALPPTTPQYSPSTQTSPPPAPGPGSDPGPGPGSDPGPGPGSDPGFPVAEPPPPYAAVNPAFFPPEKPGEPGEPALYQNFPEPGLNPDVCAEEAALTTSAFDDKTVRRAFVRKVFSIVFLQLLFTFSVVCVFTFSSTVKALVQDSIWVYVSAFIVFLVVVVPLSFCSSVSRRHPWNLLALVLVTMSLSYMVGTIASYHDTVTVVLTMGATLVISLAVIAYSVQSRYDFTVCYGLLLVLSVDLLMFGVFSSFYYSHMAQVAYGALGALLFSLFLMADVQLMMGTMNRGVSPEDYVSAALMIYLDIILIFLYLLGRR